MSRCILWTGRMWANGRYGMDKLNGKSMTAHRAVWIRKFGAIPKGLVVCHACDNSLCINPDHLLLGTMKANMMDCIQKGRFFFNISNQKGQNNGNAKPGLNERNKSIKEKRAQGWSYRQLREAFNIKSNGHIRNILSSI